MDDVLSELGSVLGAGSQAATSILGAVKGTSTTKPASATTTAAASGGSGLTNYLLIGGGILLAVVVAILAFRKGK